MTLEAHRGMWLLVGRSQLRLKRMSGQARNLTVSPEGSRETQGLGVRRGGTWLYIWSWTGDADWGSMRPVRGQFLLPNTMQATYKYYFYFLGEKLNTQSSEGHCHKEQILKRHDGICSKSKPSRRA